MIAFAGKAVLPVFVVANVTELHQINPRVQNNSSISVEWDLLGKPWISDLMQAIYFSRFLVGVLLVGQFSDKYGRQIVMRIGFFDFMLLTSVVVLVAGKNHHYLNMPNCTVF